jgi:hypothetical protein
MKRYSLRNYLLVVFGPPVCLVAGYLSLLLGALLSGKLSPEGVYSKCANKLSFNGYESCADFYFGLELLVGLLGAAIAFGLYVYLLRRQRIQHRVVIGVYGGIITLLAIGMSAFLPLAGIAISYIALAIAGLFASTYRVSFKRSK